MTPDCLHRELGTFGAAAMGLGSITSTGVFVSIGIAAGVTGPSVVLAIAIGALVATSNGLSSAQLAANHPVSGGTYEYGYRYLTPWLGFLAGWTFLLAEGASAATAALQAVAAAFGLPLLTQVLAVGAVTAMAGVLLNLLLGLSRVLAYYAITNLAALRLADEERFYPRWVAAAGLASCLTLAPFVDLVIWAVGLGLLAAGLVWHAQAARLRR